MKKIQFSKMHGLGNDFVIINAIEETFDLSTQQINELGNRRTGIGFDQLLVVESPNTDEVDFNYRIFNTDGSEVEHCGNGARCFAKFVKDKGLSDKNKLRIKVKKGIITTEYYDDNHIEVDMGKPILTPSEIPFNFASNEYQKQYQLMFGDDSLPACVLSMGNPHIVFFVSNLHNLSLIELGTAIQNSSYFPESVNVNFVEVIDENNIELRTYERGAGETNACGTGACAAAFATNEMGIGGKSIQVKMCGGTLNINIDNEQQIFMSGPARHIFDGEILI